MISRWDVLQILKVKAIQDQDRVNEFLDKIFIGREFVSVRELVLVCWDFFTDPE